MVHEPYIKRFSPVDLGATGGSAPASGSFQMHILRKGHPFQVVCGQGNFDPEEAEDGTIRLRAVSSASGMGLGLLEILPQAANVIKIRIPR